jgi:hypothetical protein
MTALTKVAFVARRLADNYDDRFWWKNQVLKFVVRPVHPVYPGDDGVRSLSETDEEQLERRLKYLGYHG